MRWLFALTALASCARALKQSEAGVVDWHQSYVGVPLVDSLATAPAFLSKPGHPPTSALLLTATSSNVLAALHPTNGSIAWRFVYEPKDSIVYYQKHDDVVLSLSGPGGSTLRTFEATTGHLLAEKRLHPPHEARLLEPADFGVAAAFVPGEPDAFVLTSGHTLRRVDSTGNVQWTWSSLDQTSLVVYSKIIATPAAIYLVGLASSFSSYTLHITSLSPSTGQLLASVNVPSSISDGPSTLLALASPDTTRVAWLEGGLIHSVALSSDLHQKPTVHKSASFVSVVDVGLGTHGHFVALKQDGSGVVLALDAGKADVATLWEFSDSARSDRYTESFYIGGVDKDGLPCVGRVFWSHVLRKGSVHVYAPHLGDGKGLVSGFTFPFDTDVHGIITHAALHVAYVKLLDLLPYVVLTTSTGAVQLWQGDRLQWTREEGLSTVQVVEMVELPEPASVHTHGIGHESFVGRMERQMAEARDFPQYLVHFITRFVTGSYTTSLSPPSSSSPSSSFPLSFPPSSSIITGTTTTLTRDPFGFRKLLLLATAHGKVYALDSATGQLLWSRVLGLGWAREVGGRVNPVKLFVTRAVGDEKVGVDADAGAEGEGEGDAAGRPQVVLVAQRVANNGLVDTVLFHIDAMTGADARPGTEPSSSPSTSRGILEGVDIISGPAVEAYLFEAPGSDVKTVVLLDEFLQVYLYPSTPATESAFGTHAPHLHLALRTGSHEHPRLTGHAFLPNSGLQNRTTAYPTWTTSLAPGEEVLDLVTRPGGSRGEKVASLGKVTGDRRTLYKYLNPNLAVVTTRGRGEGAEGGCAVRVVDGVKGSVVYHAKLGGEGCEVHAAFAENWLVYVVWEGTYAWTGQSKGWRAVSVEFYEGGEDEKTRSSEMSSMDGRSANVSVYEQSFVFPHGVSTMGMTSTKFGVTAKDLIVANDKGQIQSFPRILLNPRRPKRKTTAEEQEEMLVQYDPLLPDDPRRVLSHNHEVTSIRALLTSPSQLESTSLLFAYGLDLFATRLAPSGTFDVLSAEFNKAQLVLTVGALAIAIAVARPMVGRKRLRERWYK
ncbi:DUF1620-domain-containing protein [Amylostereum chailletii]|nr:DUF1620-domain-containing protein [Amylostereum chailletii]